jgi:hypothetical protein
MICSLLYKYFLRKIIKKYDGNVGQMNEKKTMEEY